MDIARMRARMRGEQLQDGADAGGCPGQALNAEIEMMRARIILAAVRFPLPSVRADRLSACRHLLGWIVARATIPRPNARTGFVEFRPAEMLSEMATTGARRSAAYLALEMLKQTGVIAEQPNPGSHTRKDIVSKLVENSAAKIGLKWI